MSPSQIYAILPIFNKDVVTRLPAPWSLADDLIFRAGEEIERRMMQEDSSVMLPDGVCNNVFHISFTGKNEEIEKHKKTFEDNIKLDALCLQSVFNLVAENSGTMVIPYGIIIETQRIQKIKNVVDFELDFPSSKLTSYSALPKITNQDIQLLFILTRRVIKTDKQLQTTFRRFCSAFMKSNWEDRLIDLTIALESLIPSQTEIKFKFSLYLSLIVSDNPEKRKEIHGMLSDLYDARSGIVHGTSSETRKAIEESKKNWDKLVDILKQCILYRLEFRDKFPDQDWKKHLLSLSLGNSSTNWNIEVIT